MTLIRCAELKGLPCLANRLWLVDDKSINSFDEVEVWSDVLHYKVQENLRMQTKAGCVWGLRAPTVGGDCGLAYIARFGTTWRIIGFHYEYLATDDLGVPGFAVGAIVTKQEVERLAMQISSLLQGVETNAKFLSRNPDQLVLQPYPARSEVWVALTNGARIYCFGELWPPLAGPSMKTKMQWSILRDEFTPFEIKWCGEQNYWRMPEFRGKVVDGQWKSPFTDAFTTENKGSFDEETMWMALADYLLDMDLLDRDGYATISEEQVVLGIPGSYVNSMNLKTSVGPPFNESKRKHFVVSDERVPFIDPNITDLNDDIEKCMQENNIPCAIGMCTLKDEPVKKDKMPRVFTCLPASYNMILKKYMAPVKAFMRANWQFFESAVGVDMTSADAERLVEFLCMCSPDLDCLFDGDAKRLDKSWAYAFFDFIALCFYGIAFILGVDAKPVYQMVMGLKHCKFIIKGDVFNVAWNPSGNDITVELNGVVVSLGFRYVYYLDKVKPIWLAQFIREFFENPNPRRFDTSMLDFRKRNALLTYGDDNLRGLSYKERPDATKIWFEHLGIVMTDASKNPIFEQKDITQVSFLKRNFVWSDKYSRHLTPLDLKSVVRMVLIKRESVLSSRDHACVSMSEALRELVYHGEQVYNEFKSVCDNCVSKYELQGNPYLRIFDYSHWEKQLLEGVFSAWEPRDVGVSIFEIR